MLLEKLLQNQLVRYALVLLVGVGIGAVFYPTSHIEEKISKKYEQEISSLKEVHKQEVSSLKESYDKSTQEMKTVNEESSKKVTSLTTQIHDLQSKQKTSYYKLIKPDGTIEVKKYTESEVKESSKVVSQIQTEFTQKIATIETKWETIHKQKLEEVKKSFDSKEQEYKHTIEELQKTKITDVNKKSFGVEVGANTEKQYYLHATGDLFGPIFMGVHGESDKDAAQKSIGAGLGIKF